MRTNKNDVEKRLMFKTRATIILGIALTVLIGLLLYLLPISFGMNVTFWIVGFLIFAISLPSSYFLKTPKFPVVNAFLISVSPLIQEFLNIVSPRYNFQPTIQQYLLTTSATLSCIFILISIVIWGIIRLCRGYERLYKPIIFSYVINEEVNEISIKEFRKLLRLVGAESIITRACTVEFLYKKDRYIAFFHTKEKRKTELNFLIFRLRRDTIIPPEMENVEVFFSLFNAGARKWNEQKKIAEVVREDTPHFLQETEDVLVSFYGSPIRMRFPIHLPSLRGIQSWGERHSSLTGFLGGIVATVIAGIILWYVFGIRA